MNDKIIKYQGKIFLFITQFGYGGYYENHEKTYYLLTDKDGDVAICSRLAREYLNGRDERAYD